MSVAGSLRPEADFDRFLKGKNAGEVAVTAGDLVTLSQARPGQEAPKMLSQNKGLLPEAIPC